jgi:hypothetical protein
MEVRSAAEFRTVISVTSSGYRLDATGIDVIPGFDYNSLSSI